MMEVFTEFESEQEVIQNNDMLYLMDEEESKRKP